MDLSHKKGHKKKQLLPPFGLSASKPAIHLPGVPITTTDSVFRATRFECFRISISSIGSMATKILLKRQCSCRVIHASMSHPVEIPFYMA